MFDSTKMIGEKSGRVAFLSSISHKKGPMLLLHAFYTIHKHFPEMTFHIFGDIQDPRYAVYFDHAFPELGLSDCSCYYGRIDNPMEVLPHCSYIISTSPFEGMPYNILEGLSCGLIPLIYSWVGAKDIYPREYIWENLDELVHKIKEYEKNPPDREQYKKFVSENYSQKSQFQKLDTLVENLLSDIETKEEQKKDSKVAAIIAVKNGYKTIDAALRSLYEQTKPLKEIIIIDDGSTDHTLDVVNSISSVVGYSHIKTKVIRNDSSKWVFSARNQGFNTLSDDIEYFFFLDADDWIDKNYVEKASKLLDENSAVSVVYPDMIYFNNYNEKQFNQPEFDAKLLTQQNFIAYSSMQRASSFKKIGGFSEYLNDTRNHQSEWYLWLNYLKHGFSIKHLPEPLFHYFHDDSSDQMSGLQERSRDDQSLELALNLSDDHSEIQMLDNGKKKIVLVAQGRDYCDRTKTGFELIQLYYPLTTFGDTYAFSYDIEQKYYGNHGMNERLIHFLDIVKPDYVFHFSYKTDILPSTWDKISYKYCTICFHSDDDRRYSDYSKDYGSHFRYSVTTYPDIYEIMEHPGKILSAWGVNTHYLKPNNKDKTIDVSFVGQKYGDREELLKDIPEVEVYGSGWDSGFVDYKELSKILASSKISINFSKGADGNKQVKLRSFEICACNTLCLCEKVNGIEEFYVPDQEIVLFEGKQDLISKIDYYLQHEDERKKIALAGYNKTISKYTWEHRLTNIFEEINEQRK